MQWQSFVWTEIYIRSNTRRADTLRRDATSIQLCSATAEHFDTVSATVAHPPHVLRTRKQNRPAVPGNSIESRADGSDHLDLLTKLKPIRLQLSGERRHLRCKWIPRSARLSGLYDRSMFRGADRRMAFIARLFHLQESFTEQLSPPRVLWPLHLSEETALDGAPLAGRVICWGEI